jgi:cysteinyl-tRNA synthetase, unknown class
MTRNCRATLAFGAILLLLCPACPFGGDDGDTPDNGYRQAMRDFVQDLSVYAKGHDTNFLVVPQNGLDLLTLNGDPAGAVATDYVAALDGVGQEHPYYGEDAYDQATSAASRDTYLAFLDLAEGQGLEALVTDYCSTQSKVDNSYAWNAARGYISFAAYGADYGLDNVPPYPANPYGVNPGYVTALTGAQNFLYLIDPSGFASRNAFLNTVAATNHDLLIVDLFDASGTQWSSTDVAAFKQKANGGTRLVLAYMNIGAAENWRYYWQTGWSLGNPSWIASAYEGWAGEYWVRYWDDAWQDIIFGSTGAYLDRIIAAGFDGVYLDNILAYEQFE